MNKVFGGEEYRATITLIKMAAGFLPGSAAAGVLAVIAELPAEAVWPLVIVVVANGVYRGLRNLSKQKFKFHLP